MARTLEEIEAQHAARAQANGQPTGEEQEVEQEEVEQEETPDYEAEIARLQQELAAANGRAAPEQRRAEEYRRQFEDAERARQQLDRQRQEEINALREQLEAREAEVNLEELLTPEERDMFDPAQLTAITKVADAIAQRRAPKVDAKTEALAALRERETQQVDDYRTQIITDPTRSLSRLHTLAHDPKFQAWISQEENDDFDVLVNSLLQANTKDLIDRRAKAVEKRIARFNEQGKTRNAGRQTDPQQSLSSAMQRRPQKVSDAEMQGKIAEAKRLARSANPKDRAKAKQILDSI